VDFNSSTVKPCVRHAFAIADWFAGCVDQRGERSARDLIHRLRGFQPVARVDGSRHGESPVTAWFTGCVDFNALGSDAGR
jgi:hypothetical protein